MANPFSGFFDNLINGALSPKGNLGDYSHASKTFVDGNMRLAPKLKQSEVIIVNSCGDAKKDRDILRERLGVK